MRYRNKRNGRVCKALVITNKTIGDDILHFAYPKIKTVTCDYGNTFIIKLNNISEYLSTGDVLIKYRTNIDVLYKEEFEENFEEIRPIFIPFKGGEKVYTNKETQEKSDDRISLDLTFGGDFDSVEFTDEMRDFAIRKITKAIREQGR